MRRTLTKRVIALAAILGLGFMGFGATCNLLHFSLTQIGTHDTFAGELQNNTGANFLGHKFKVAFVNSNGDVVDTKTGVDGCLRSWQNGASDFFSVASTTSSSTTAAAIGSLDLGSPLIVGTTVNGDATISNVVTSRDATSMTVTGTLKNNDSVTLTSPAVCIVVYNSSNNVVTTAKGTLSSITAGASRDFSVTVTVPDSTTSVNHVDVWADGLENNIPIDPVSRTGATVATATPTNTATVTATPCSTGGTPTTCTPTATPTTTLTPTPTNTATATPTP